MIQSLYKKLKSIPLVLLGLGLCRAWSVAMFSGAYPNGFAGAFMLFAASTAVGGLVLAALAPRVSPLYKNKHLLLAAALLMGLVINLLFQVLRRAGLEALPAALACLLFGGVLYLAALQAQGIHLRRLFRLC